MGLQVRLGRAHVEPVAAQRDAVHGSVLDERGKNLALDRDLALLDPAQDRGHGDDEGALERHNAAIMDAVNQSGDAFLSHTKLDGRYVLRLAIGNLHTTEAHVRRAWDRFRDEFGEASALH